MKQKVTVVGNFSTRSDAELAVEHLVQEHGVSRGDIDVHAAGAHNTAGSRPTGTDDAAKIEGPVEISVGCPDENAAKVRSVLKEAGMR